MELKNDLLARSVIVLCLDQFTDYLFDKVKFFINNDRVILWLVKLWPTISKFSYKTPDFALIPSLTS